MPPKVSGLLPCDSVSTKSIPWIIDMSFYQYSLIKRLATVALFLGPALAGCDAPPAEENEASAAPRGHESSAAEGRNWLDIKDGISPAIWLASREAGRDVPPNDPMAATLRALIEQADIRFSEGPRMIANRAVQVQAMLAERGVRETAREVIEGLVSIGQVGERAGFGETCQHYVNARMASGSRVAALDALRRLPLPAATGAEER